mmetsp:Transcript_25263/g.64764  ORF Transcript_25263/g.64764 Transcript_25263/m.64764 type:complete len:173 (-) Transcript_25263:143-661(-)
MTEVAWMLFVEAERLGSTTEAGTCDMLKRFSPNFFGGRDPFADFFNDDFFSGGMGRASSGSFGSFGFGGFGGSPFNDPFFSGGGGGMQSSSFSSGFGGMGGMSSSTSTSTRIVNGQRVTVTEKVVRHADGREERTITEQTQDRNGNVHTTTRNGEAIGNAQSGVRTGAQLSW